MLLDGSSIANASLVPSAETPILFGAKLQAFKRPDLFIRGAAIFCNGNPSYSGEILASAHCFDESYAAFIRSLIPEKHAHRFHLDAPRASNLREPLIAGSVFVAPSDFESFCLSAYEASLLGAVVIVNGANPAFGDDTPWRDGENCVKFDGTALGLSRALERAFARERPLSVVQVRNDPKPWAITGSTERAQTAPVKGDAPLVSVVIPHYNLAQYLPATLKSVVEQTYSNVEIILVDDRSTARESEDLIARLGEIHRNSFKVIVAPGNLGLAAARNLGISAARGKYTLPLDADDLIDRRFIKVAVEALEANPEFDVLVTQAGHFRDEAEIPLPGEERDFSAYSIFIGEAVLSGVKENRLSTATALFRTQILRDNPYCESLRCYEDWNLYLRLVHGGSRFLVTADVYFYYRYRPDSMVRATCDPAAHSLFVHDMLRNAIKPERLAPLSYLAFPSEVVELPPPPPPPPPAPRVVVEVWPLPLARENFKALFIEASEHQIRRYRVKRFFTYLLPRPRRRYRKKMRLWKAIQNELRALNAP